MPGRRKRRQFKQTDAFTRGMVIGLKRAGWSIRQIAADTHIGASKVHRLWRRWLEQGNVAIYRNVGATRVTSVRVDRRILRQAVAAPQATCTAILQHVQDTLDHSISTRIISRRLVANGLHSCRPLRRLPLTPPNRRQRLEWCRARSTWMTEWHRIVFSDESRFCLSSDSRRVRVWRRRGERSNPAAIVERPTVRQRGIMVWGAIAYDSRSPLLRIQNTMMAQRYVDDVLRPVTLPYLQGVPNALYQQDNARPHTARISQQALQDVQMLPWPPYTPDLSPIEHVWDIIGRRLHALPQPRSEDELWQMVEREWRAIPQDAIRTLIDSLPRRVAACIAVRGTPKGPRDNNDIYEETSEETENTLAKKLKSDDPALIALERNLTRMVDRAVEDDLQDWWRSFESLAERKRHVLINVSAKIHLKLYEFKKDKTISSEDLDRFFTKITKDVQEVYNMKKAFDILDDTQVRQMSDAILLSAIYPNSVEYAGFLAFLGKVVSQIGAQLIFDVPKNWMATLVKEALEYLRRRKHALSGLEKQSTYGYLHNPLERPLLLSPERKSRDPVLSKHWEQLINFLDNNLLTIINGRTISDKTGNCTFISSRGSSVVDYFIVSYSLLEHVVDVKVDNNPYSDHLPLTINMSNLSNLKRTKETVYPCFERYRWAPDNTSLFSQNLDNNQVSTDQNLDSLVNTFSKQILNAMLAADMRIKVRPGRPKSKPWYSRECYLAKKSAKASLTTFKKTNTDVDRNIYVSNRKRYTTLINFNKKKYLQEKLELLKNAQITREISSLANEKACGADEIPNEALKTLPFEHLVTLKNIFNRIINSGSYPLIWSKSIIHPIFKSGDRDNTSNYRGIALISNLSKLFTSILKSRLRNWIEGRSIIPENQAGFRKGYSCQDHIFTLLSLIQLTLRRLDFRFVNLIRNYFEQMTTTVRWNGLFTEPIKIRSGVLQGEPSSPYLFILFVTDLINIFNDSTLPGIYLPNFGTVHLLMYADDIILIGESKINLQIKINMLKKYFETNHLTLNESKSKIMVFRNGGRPAKSDKWFWGDQLLTVTSKYLYLGYPLTTTISFSQVASYFKGKALAATGEVRKIMEKSRLNSFGSSMKLLDSIILSTLLYSAPIWANEKYKILDQIQNNYLRRLLNLPSNTPGYILRMETGRFSLGVTATKLILKFWLRILKMEKSRLPAICLAQLWETSTLTNTFIGFTENFMNILNSTGFMWLKNCSDPNILQKAIPQIIRTTIEQSIQTDQSRITNSKLHTHYKYLHKTFAAENYLLSELPLPAKRLIAQLRILFVLYREDHIKYLRTEDLYCQLCKNRTENEF
ncbi:hypothetical protein LAZ67_3000604 [Cordylochernes scorpioides]|uniref:Reverse transcriptase domain-containing protein n=1 Tax=Cordylochernes scorpioides TaxID=51811 RepID=A0ABY6K6C3_9ARAC|nr:hypothetical protein LAZ67_3000604 [Cordylochernes scorpioides]